MRFHPRWAVAALSVIALGVSSIAHAALVWNQTPGAVYQIATAEVSFCSLAHENDVTNTLFSVSTASTSETCSNGGASSSVGGSNFSPFGGTLTGTGAVSVTDGTSDSISIGSGIYTSNVYLFDVLDSGGVDVRIDYSWLTSTTGIAGFSESHSFGLLKRADGCNNITPDSSNCGSAASTILPLSFLDFPGGTGSYSAIAHLLPGTYSLSSGLTLSWTSTNGDLNGSAFGEYSLSIAVVPIPAAAWLFGSGLAGLLGVARRKKISA